MSSLLITHLGLHNHKMLFRLWWHDMVTIATVEFVTASYPNNGSWSFLRILGSLLLTRQSITCQLLTITIIDCQGLAKSGLDMGLPGNRAHQFLMVKHSFNVPPPQNDILICVCVYICVFVYPLVIEQNYWKWTYKIVDFPIENGGFLPAPTVPGLVVNHEIGLALVPAPVTFRGTFEGSGLSRRPQKIFIAG